MQPRRREGLPGREERVFQVTKRGLPARFGGAAVSDKLRCAWMGSTHYLPSGNLGETGFLGVRAQKRVSKQ